jgi:hypothetical protein
VIGELERSVRELLGPNEWKLKPAPGGSGGQSWVADGEGRRLFVKVGADGSLLRRLGQLGVAPPFVASHQLDRGDLVVQEFVEGVHPHGRWLDGHVAEIGRLMKVYHAVVGIREGVTALSALYALDGLRQRLSALTAQLNGGVTDVLSKAIQAIAGSAAETYAAEPVVTHGDPNTSNLILGSDRSLYLVDWDEARVSDPLRDIGQVLWWYVRPERWGDGLAACDLPDTSSVRQRVYWWAAEESVDVALGLLEHGLDVAAGDFARDALAAARGLTNPRAWWLR